MTTEQLKAKLQKKKEETQKIEKEIKEKEQAEKKALEQAAKLEGLSPQISEAIEALLKMEKVTLPEGKQIILVVGTNGELLTNILNGKVPKAAKKNGGTITVDGEQVTWARLCEIKNVPRTPGGSAHRDIFNKARELHDTIQHHCPIDGKDYPEAETES